MLGPRFMLSSLGVASFSTSRQMLRLLCQDVAQLASRAVFLRHVSHAVTHVFGSDHVMLDLAEETLDEVGVLGAEFIACAFVAACLMLVVFAACSRTHARAPGSFAWLWASARAKFVHFQ